MWTENFQMFKLDFEKAEEQEIKLPTSVGSLKEQKFQKNIYFCSIYYAKAFDCVDYNKLENSFFSFCYINFKKFIYFNWRLITLEYCSGFCHTLTWISHGCTCVHHPEPTSHLPHHLIPLGHPSGPALSTLSHASNLGWWSVSHMIIYMFQWYSGKFLKRWEYQTTLPASWELCMLIKKQQLELNMGH